MLATPLSLCHYYRWSIFTSEAIAIRDCAVFVNPRHVYQSFLYIDMLCTILAFCSVKNKEWLRTVYLKPGEDAVCVVKLYN